MNLHKGRTTDKNEQSHIFKLNFDGLLIYLHTVDSATLFYVRTRLPVVETVS